MTGRGGLLAVALGGLLWWSVAGCGGEATGGQSPAGPAQRSGSTGTPSAAGVAARIEEQAKGYPDQYAGLEIVPSGIVVYRKPGGGLDAAVRAAAPAAGISFRDASHTRVELSALATRITADSAYWNAQSVAVWSVAARHDGTGVEVGTPTGDKLLVAARARYGMTVPIIVRPMSSQPVIVASGP